MHKIVKIVYILLHSGIPIFGIPLISRNLGIPNFSIDIWVSQDFCWSGLTSFITVLLGSKPPTQAQINSKQRCEL